MDISRAPVGEARLRAILDEVIAHGDAVESAGLEVKSDIDPSAKGTGIAKIVKFILGMANRKPHVAEKYFKGYGVMVIGAKEGAAPGIPSGVESHELSDRLAPYLGPSGPVWDMARLPADDGREVLFIVVDPPKNGQPPFPCHKDFQDGNREGGKGTALSNGALYVRDKSQTRQAKADEVLALWERSRAASPEIVVDFSVEGRALSVLDEESGLRRLFEDQAKKTRVDAAKSQSRLNDQQVFGKGVSDLRDLFPKILGPALAESGSQHPPANDPETAIRDREARGWARWPECRENLYAITGERIVFTIENQAATYLSEPQIIVKIHGAWGLIPKDVDDVARHRVLPFVDPPAKTIYGVYAFDSIRSTIRPFSGKPELAWSNAQDGSMEIVLTPPALRPMTPWQTDDDELVLICSDSEATELRGTWSLTAEGFGQRFDGEFTIPIQRVPDAIDLMRVYEAMPKEF